MNNTKRTIDLGDDSLDIAILRYLKSTRTNTRYPTMEVISETIRAIHPCSYEAYDEALRFLYRIGCINATINSKGEINYVMGISLEGRRILQKSFDLHETESIQLFRPEKNNQKEDDLFKTIINLVRDESKIKKRVTTSYLEGKLSFNGTLLNRAEISGVLAKMEDLQYLMVQTVHQKSEKTIVKITDKGNYFMTIGKSENSASKSQTNNFYGNMGNSQVAFGDHSKQEQTHYHNESAKEIIETLIPLLEKVVQDSQTPQQVREQTVMVLEDLGELEEGNRSVSFIKDKLNALLPHLTSAMGTQVVASAMEAIGKVLLAS